MAKVIVLNFQSGSFEKGFEVSLRIEEIIQGGLVKKLLGMEEARQLAASEIPKLYQQWLSSYEQLEPLRLSVPQGTSYNTENNLKNCAQNAESLRKEVMTWLKSQEIGDLREKILVTVTDKTEELRVFISTKDDYLRRLPWQYWDLFDETYSHAEIALCPLDYDTTPGDNQRQSARRIKILAILGNVEGIDVSKERQFLINLVGEENCRFLSQPSRSEVSDNLWEQSWDILFFAGHSKSGFISLNRTESLSIAELKQGLRKTIRKGLQLAIFNSCDGLKLAEDLADLHIPQVIVMREPVPDKVAQDFLSHFLTPLATGQSLYLSMREARGRLSDKWDKEFPGASWLPIIYQNPLADSFEWPVSEITEKDILDIIGYLAQEYPKKHPNGRVSQEAIIDAAKDRFKLWSSEVNTITNMLTVLCQGGYLDCSAGGRYSLTLKKYK
jgi:hypothetical protein